MKKPIAVKINNKEEYNLAIEALDLAGFKWYVGLSMRRSDYSENYRQILVNPRCDRFTDDKLACVFYPPPGSSLGDNDGFEFLSIDDFVSLFSSMTEKDAIAFCDSYFTEADEYQEDGKKKSIDEKLEISDNGSRLCYLDISIQPNIIDVASISDYMFEEIKERWRCEVMQNGDTVAKIGKNDFLDFCCRFPIPMISRDDVEFLLACSLAFVEAESWSHDMANIRVLI